MASNFNIVIKQIIKKSLFTERQIEIITSIWDNSQPISRGAYYRQKAQTKQKTKALLYSMVLLHGLGTLPEESVRVAGQMADQISVIFDSDIDDETASAMLNVMERAIDRLLEQ